ncbi:hypothetical protein JRQ81_008681 [Phrynocephalus forsythii]|uniref:Uncharacterized protein n=1 Tax=Phrynocephalus forsythii TaxID=171643 RepID=A0A9Q1ASX0_9SAUR|nr:hypothetical protein JRQ81_008681 [Phrynocephalus forsythii]
MEQRKLSDQANTLVDLSKTQNVMYEMVSELQERSEDLEKRIGALEGQIDRLGLTLHALPGLVSQAIHRHQHPQHPRGALSCPGGVSGSVPGTPSSSSERSSWTPARHRKSLSTAPHTASDSGCQARAPPALYPLLMGCSSILRRVSSVLVAPSGGETPPPQARPFFPFLNRD